jgi:hypothetical protein
VVRFSVFGVLLRGVVDVGAVSRSLSVRGLSARIVAVPGVAADRGEHGGAVLAAAVGPGRAPTLAIAQRAGFSLAVEAEAGEHSALGAPIPDALAAHRALVKGAHQICQKVRSGSVTANTHT